MKGFILAFILLYSANIRAQINEGSLVTKNEYFEIPYSDTKNEIRTKATIKGDSYDFMMDSGAPVFISSELRKKYNLKLIVHAKTKDAGGKTFYIDIVRIDTLQFGPFVFTGIPALVFDLKNSPLECSNFGGNIGSNILRHLVVQFDVKSGKIYLTDNGKLLKKPLPELRHMTVDGQSDVYFPVMLNNNLTDTIHFDTGDGQLYNISKRKAQKFASLYPGEICRKGYGTISMGIGGMGAAFPQYVFKPGQINIGDNLISNGRIYIAGNDKSRMGRDLLNYGVLTLDYTQSGYAFEKYAEEYRHDNYDYGFYPVIDGKNVLAGTVWNNTTAAQMGMKPGNELLKLNDVELKSLPKCDVEQAIKQQLRQNRQTVSVTFKDKAGKAKTITLEKNAL